MRRLLLLLLIASVHAAGARADLTAATVVTVSAASFETTSVAPDAIVAAFGTQLSTQTTTANDTDAITPGVQLPVELGGTSVEVNGRPANLLFVSPGQINFIIPAQTESGAANVVVRAGDGSLANGTVQVAAVSSGIFTANSDGHGVAAALVLRLHSDLSFNYEGVAELNPVTNRYVAAPIDLGPEGERVFLVLFATGIRHAADPNGDGNLNESVRVLLGGEELVPSFAGRHPDFAGLDQINLEIPRTLIGRGEVSFALAAPGFTSSNLAEVVIAGPPNTTPPLVSSFGTTPALAGQTLTINGSGFSLQPAENVVRIGGIEALVTVASATALTVVVPFGAETGSVSVRTPLGEGTSSGPLQVRTSISGFVENTSQEPMSGVRIKLVGTSITTQTTAEGSFVLPDVPTGTQYVDVDGESIPTTPPYPKITLKTIAFASRDNQFPRPVALQQSTGASGSVGSSSAFGRSSVAGTSSFSYADQLLPVPISTAGFTLLLPANVDAVFPGGGKSGTIFLTPLKDGRMPLDLPPGIFSSSIVQITPFDVQLNPGAKLTFPNADGLPAGRRRRSYSGLIRPKANSSRKRAARSFRPMARLLKLRRMRSRGQATTSWRAPD